jgi:hypothetical protein
METDERNARANRAARERIDMMGVLVRYVLSNTADMEICHFPFAFSLLGTIDGTESGGAGCPVSDQPAIRAFANFQNFNGYPGPFCSS